MRFPQPLNPQLIEEPDVYRSVGEFIGRYALPTLPDESIRTHVGQGGPKPLAAQGESAIMTIRGTSRQYSYPEDFDAMSVNWDQDGKITIAASVHAEMQVRFCSPGDEARRRAQALETAAGSGLARYHFHDRGITCLNVEDLVEDSYTDQGGAYVCSYLLTLRLSYRTGLAVDLPWFDSITLNRLENVDAHHPPKE